MTGPRVTFRTMRKCHDCKQDKGVRAFGEHRHTCLVCERRKLERVVVQRGPTPEEVAELERFDAFARSVREAAGVPGGGR